MKTKTKTDKSPYLNIFKDILNGAKQQISNIKPADWVESNRYMTPDVSPIPGKFSFNNSPYVKEIINRLATDDPAKIIAVMKGAQIGMSTGLIEGGIGWIISQEPGNILFLVGHEDLVKDASAKVDRMIDNSGIRNLIKSNSLRVRKTKSGDTDYMKEFPSGMLKMGIANHKALRNISMRYGFIDDYESMRGASAQSGSTESLIMQRFAAYAKKMKLFFISTPELKENSNIEAVYLKGDQRKYHIPCPCCGEKIMLEWEIQSIFKPGTMAGIKWELDENNRLIEDSVKYECYLCGGTFDDSNKAMLIRQGEWIPTAEPSEPGYFSYHISSLYAPPYMFTWTVYVRQYIEANPVGEKRNEEKHKTWQNLCLGYTYEKTGKSIKASDLQNNIREYPILTIPEKMSLADGNGKIVLLTLGSDMNGLEDDARLDYEIVAWSESGASYSIVHGSIGTFFNKDRGKIDRERFTYKHNAPNSIWPILKDIIKTQFTTDTGRKMAVFISGLDVGYNPSGDRNINYAYQFLDSTSLNVIGLKGKGEDKYQNVEADLKTYRKSKERDKMYLVESNKLKDILSNYMTLRWDSTWQETQPANFLNFPTPSSGLYLMKNYFSHFESEEKVIDKNRNFIWKKKNSASQNHMFDCRLYAVVTKDILVDQVLKENKITGGWKEFCLIILKGKSGLN